MPDITIGRLRGGLCASWRDEDGKRRRYQLKARQRKEAEAEALEIYRQKTYAERPRGQTIAQMWQGYVEELGSKQTATTMTYTGKAVLPHFGAYRPEDITREMCRAYARDRMAAGIKQGTVWTELGHLQSTLNHAVGKKNAPKIWRPEKPEPSMRILNPGEARAVIDACIAPHVRLAVILMLGTGARVGAILDLTWDRVDFDGNYINLRLPDAATRKGRAVVPMSKGVRAALSVAREAALSEFVVEYAGGQVGSVRKGVSEAIRRSGIGHVRIHDFRHTAAVTMLAAGQPIEKVGQVLGHSNIAMTYKVYGRFLPDHMQDAVDVLDFSRFDRNKFGSRNL